MTQTLDELRRETGDLLKAVDWNDLLDAIALGDDDARAYVQTRIDALRALIAGYVQGTATVHVSAGESIDAAVRRLPTSGGEIALSTGVHELAQPLVISNRRRIAIVGAGAATIVRAPQHEQAILVDGCQEVLVARLRIEGGTPATREPGIRGALSVLGGSDVAISQCVLACPHGVRARLQSCLTVQPNAVKSRTDRLRVERCRLEVGSGQTGLLVVDAQDTAIERTHVVLAAGATAGATVGQGIVVAGARVGAVSLVDNIVDDTIQGIRIGVSRRGIKPDPAVEVVALAGNVVNALVPTAHRRDRFGIFVGNARSISIEHTTATLRRAPQPGSTRVTPVEGLRLHGTFGPFLHVRGTSLRDFQVGIRVVALHTPSVAMWAVTETMSDGAAQGVLAPAAVLQERNFPASAPAGPGAPARVLVAPAVDTKAQRTAIRFVATAVDAAGRRVPGVPMTFAVAGANPRAAQKIVTDANGDAVFEYTGAETGTDSIVAFADLNGNGVQDIGEPFATATGTFLPPVPARIAFDETAIAGTTGRPVALGLVVSDATGHGLGGVTVDIAITGANAGAQPALTTDARGRATVRYTGAAPGSDAVTASVAPGGGAATLRTTATVTYREPVPTGLVLFPPQGTALRGESLTFEAHVTDAAGQAISGATVQFTVSGTHSTGARLTTDAGGAARFSYSGANAGTDTVVAYADVARDGTRDVTDPFAQAVATFVAPPPTRVRVPPLIGATEAEATARLTSAGLVARVVSGTIDWVVLANPAANTEVLMGSTVDLYLREPSGGGGSSEPVGPGPGAIPVPEPEEPEPEEPEPEEPEPEEPEPEEPEPEEPEPEEPEPEEPEPEEPEPQEPEPEEPEPEEPEPQEPEPQEPEPDPDDGDKDPGDDKDPSDDGETLEIASIESTPDEDPPPGKPVM